MARRQFARRRPAARMRLNQWPVLQWSTTAQNLFIRPCCCTVRTRLHRWEGRLPSLVAGLSRQRNSALPPPRRREMVDHSAASGPSSSPGAACKAETCCHHSQSAMFPRRSRQGYWPTDDLRSRPGRCRHSEQGRLETCTQPPSPPDLHHATLCHTYSTENRIRKDQCHSERWLYSTASADQRVRRPGSSQARCHSGCRPELTHDKARNAPARSRRRG